MIVGELGKEAKISIIQVFAGKITIDKENISIIFCYIPSLSLNPPKSPHNTWFGSNKKAKQ